jgi:hypothetical protein
MGLDTNPRTSIMLIVSLMTNFNQNVIKHKLGLFNLAEELNNVSRACRLTVFLVIPSIGTRPPKRKVALRHYLSRPVADQTRI